MKFYRNDATRRFDLRAISVYDGVVKRCGLPSVLGQLVVGVPNMRILDDEMYFMTLNAILVLIVSQALYI
jgi:hypothetical protein